MTDKNTYLEIIENKKVISRRKLVGLSKAQQEDELEKQQTLFLMERDVREASLRRTKKELKIF